MKLSKGGYRHTILSTTLTPHLTEFPSFAIWMIDVSRTNAVVLWARPSHWLLCNIWHIRLIIQLRMGNPLGIGIEPFHIVAGIHRWQQSHQRQVIQSGIGTERLAATRQWLRLQKGLRRHSARCPAPEDNRHLVPPDDIHRRLQTLCSDVGQLSASCQSNASIHRLRDWLRGDDTDAGRGGRTFLAVRDVVFRSLRHHHATAVESACLCRLLYFQEQAVVMCGNCVTCCFRWQICCFHTQSAIIPYSWHYKIHWTVA